MFRPSHIFFRFIELVNEIPGENEEIPEMFLQIISMVTYALYLSLAIGWFYYLDHYKSIVEGSHSIKYCDFLT